MRVLRALAVCGPVLFTLDWLLLGWSHAGYRPDRETISSLSAHGASRWPLMIVGQLALAAALVAVAALTALALGSAGAVAATLFGLAALGTLQLSTFRTICNQTDRGWCTPLPRSAYPHQQWAHGIGTGVAFACLLLACLACAWATWRLSGLRDVAVVALVVEAVALPCILVFLTTGTTWHGLTEKLFLTSLSALTVYAGARFGSFLLARGGAPAPRPVSR